MKVIRKFDKRGVSSHFEMIAAFVLFFTFVVFLLLFIKPYQTGTLQGSVVAGLHDSFREQAETNLSKFFLKADNSDLEGCFYIKLPGELFGFVFTETLVRAVDSGVEKRSELEDSASDAKLNIDADNTFYYVMISPDFTNEDLSGCHELIEYELGSIDEKKVVSYSELVEMKENYDSDYKGLKEDMDFPDAYDFAIVSDLITMEGVVPEEGEIVADDYIEEVLLDDGTLKNYRFTLKVW